MEHFLSLLTIETLLQFTRHEILHQLYFNYNSSAFRRMKTNNRVVVFLLYTIRSSQKIHYFIRNKYIGAKQVFFAIIPR